MSDFVEHPIYDQLARIGKALASPVRLRLLDLLDTSELTVEQVAELAGLPVKNTSAQLQQLRAAQLVTTRRAGTHVHYRVANDTVSAFLGTFHGFAQDTLADLRAEIEHHLGPANELRPVTAVELKRLQDKDNVLVVDVRAAVDYEREHVPGAISVPVAAIRDRLADIPSDREIVAYCQGPYCVSSPDAVRELTAAGRSARILAGGWTAWARSGLQRSSS